MCRSGAPGATHSGDVLCARSVRVVGAQIGSYGVRSFSARMNGPSGRTHTRDTVQDSGASSVNSTRYRWGSKLTAAAVASDMCRWATGSASMASKSSARRHCA